MATTVRSIRIPDELWDKAKTLAEGGSRSKLICDLLREAIPPGPKGRMILSPLPKPVVLNTEEKEVEIDPTPSEYVGKRPLPKPEPCKKARVLNGGIWQCQHGHLSRDNGKTWGVAPTGRPV